MTEEGVVRQDRTSATAADRRAEAAVRRLIQAGMSRTEALKLIDQTLYQVIGQMNAAGIGGLAPLRQMNLSVGMKLNALRVEQANREDAGYDRSDG